MKKIFLFLNAFLCFGLAYWRNAVDLRGVILILAGIGWSMELAENELKKESK